MHKLLFFIIFILLLSCQSKSSKHEGGFDYPKNYKLEDTIFYFFPLKNTYRPKDKIYQAITYCYYKKLFNEPNYSLKPFKKETYRLFIENSLDYDYVITVNEDFVTVKRGAMYMKESSLTKQEARHLRYMNYYYPFDSSVKKLYNKFNKDSLLKIYPELATEKYYQYLLQKDFTSQNDSFTYNETKLQITKTEFNSFLHQIDSTNYWQMPFEVITKQPFCDGAGIILEANTQDKYKVVSSDFSSENENLNKLCKFIIKLAKLDKTEEVYKRLFDTTKREIIIEDDKLEPIKL